MSKLFVKSYIKYLFFLVWVTFIFNKMLIRPWVLKNDFPSFFNILVYSFPNFCEAVLGTILLMGFAWHLRSRFQKQFGRFSDSSLYLIVTIVAGFYVISQELKFHNLGGNNTYDPYDLVASIVGLIFFYCISNKYGFAGG